MTTPSLSGAASAPAAPAPPVASDPEPRRPEPAAAAPQAPAILKSGVVDGMAYTLYADGSIEAKMPTGTVRFGSTVVGPHGCCSQTTWASS